MGEERGLSAPSSRTGQGTTDTTFEVSQFRSETHDGSLWPNPGPQGSYRLTGRAHLSPWSHQPGLNVSAAPSILLPLHLFWRILSIFLSDPMRMPPPSKSPSRCLLPLPKRALNGIFQLLSICFMFPIGLGPPETASGSPVPGTTSLADLNGLVQRDGSGVGERKAKPLPV